MDNKKRISEILTLLKKEYPKTKVSLNYNTPFELLVATILSAQATDKSVNEVLPKLFAQYPNAYSMAKSTPKDIKPLIKSIGLYNNKSKSLSNMAKILVEKYDGNVPKTMKELTSLPGVGRKTANVVLGNSFNIVIGITVDTHVIRLSNRMGFVNTQNPTRIEKELMNIVPKEYWVNITTLFIDHGRKICGRKPKCNECVVSELCNSAFNFDHFQN